jgi:tetratricopeptide (TPR) repeat protein
LHLLLSTDEVAFEHYRKVRHHAAEGWSDVLEGRAVATALEQLHRPVVIAISLAERLSKSTWDFLDGLINTGAKQIKLILCFLTHCDALPVPVDREIQFQAPEHRDIQLLCRQRGLNCDDDVLRVLNLNPEADLNTIFLAASLLAHGAADSSPVLKCVTGNDTKSLCNLALDGISTEARNVLKAAILFRTPIDAESLKTVTRSESLEKVRSNVAELRQRGCLLAMHPAAPECYSVGTTIREHMSGLFWGRTSPHTPMRKDKRDILLSLAAHFEELALNAIMPHPERRAACRAIPFLSAAFHYYRAAADREAYCKLATNDYVSGLLTNMYHSRVLRTWLDAAPKLRCSDALLDYKALNVLGILARMHSMTSDYARYLEQGEQKLREARQAAAASTGEKVNLEQMEASLTLEKGIMLTMKRQYPEALETFTRASSLPRATSRDKQRIQLRIVQTQLSLGRIAEANARLRALRKTFSAAKARGETLHHSWAMLNRHNATICIIRAILYHLRPKDRRCPTKEDLLAEAEASADECYRESQQDQETPRRFGLPDETGMGIARFKKAHALFVGAKYDECISNLEEAVAVLSGYPDSRWWRMCCHDLLCKVYAMRGELEKARPELAKATQIWKDSAEEDNVRRAELCFSEGLINFQSRKYALAQRFLEKSVSFKEQSPCILAVHLKWLSMACLANDDINAASDAMTRAAGLEIHW